MALPSSVHRFELEISDVDRGVYERAEFRLALHPSETVAFALVRVLAYALEYRSDLAFGRGIGYPDEPALSAPDGQGGTALWVDVGAPSADRLHKAAKAVAEVVVYTHKDLAVLQSEWSSRAVHRAEQIRVMGVPRALLDELEAAFDRVNRWTVLRTEGVVYITVGAKTFSGALEMRTLVDRGAPA